MENLDFSRVSLAECSAVVLTVELFLAVYFVRYGKLLATLSAASCQYATAVSGQHALTETMLVVSLSVVRLESSFHFSLCCFCFLIYNQAKRRRSAHRRSKPHGFASQRLLYASGCKVMQSFPSDKLFLSLIYSTARIWRCTNTTWRRPGSYLMQIIFSYETRHVIFQYTIDISRRALHMNNRHHYDSILFLQIINHIGIFCDMTNRIVFRRQRHILNTFSRIISQGLNLSTIFLIDFSETDLPK